MSFKGVGIGEYHLFNLLFTICQEPMLRVHPPWDFLSQNR